MIRLYHDRMLNRIHAQFRPFVANAANQWTSKPLQLPKVSVVERYFRRLGLLTWTSWQVLAYSLKLAQPFYLVDASAHPCRF
jgi:hypothetical protein